MKFHLGRKGPARCRALIRTCPFGGPEAHFDSLREAEEALASQYASFIPVAKPSLEQVRDSYQRLFLEDDELDIEAYDPKVDETLYTYAKRVSNEQLHNPDFLAPKIESLSLPTDPGEALGLAMKAEAYVNAEALETLRHDIFECRKGELDAQQKQDEATERYFLGWRAALELVRDGVSEDLVADRIPAGDLLRSWAALKAKKVKSDSGLFIGTMEDVRLLVSKQCAKHSLFLDEQESLFDHDTPEHEGYVDALLKFEAEAKEDQDEIFISDEVISENEEDDLEEDLEEELEAASRE